SDKYGWEIAKDIKQRTGGKYEIKQPTLYAYLKRLENNDLIRSYWGGESNGGRRRYYALTDAGRSLCQQFTSEWQYQQNVLNSLIDLDENNESSNEFAQDDATPLFGSKVKSHKRKKQSSQDELDEIERRLNELSQASESQTEAPSKDTGTSQEVNDLQLVEESTTSEIAHQEETEVEKYVSLSERQDTESFLSEFEKRLQELSERKDEEERQSAPRKNVFDDMLSQANDEERHVDVNPLQPASTRRVGTVALEDVAENLATKGIRMRIYNRDTAKYTPQTLICKNKVNCLTSWIVYLFYVVGFAIMWAATADAVDISIYAGVLAVLILAPLAFSVLYLLKPIRAPKTEVNAKAIILITSLITLGVAVLWSGVAILFGLIDFADTLGLVTKWLIPLWLFFGAPLASVMHNALTNYYSK
ncbi:MAG: helix-turn-helix transcriptional regulator, partial [Clostridia bacterium]|nr:helix-turn-helix transcriptional regulator [Clostridia bacterium]